MNDVMKALGRAFRSMVRPRMLALAIWPMVAALALWLGLAWLHWDSWSQWLAAAIAGSDASRLLSSRSLDRLAHYSALLLMLLVLAPAILITALLIAAVLAMPMIVSFVAARDYPALEPRRRGSFAGSILNALTAILVIAVLWIVSLPLWLTGVLAPLLPLLLSAYLNQRLFRYDALSEHASAEEFRALLEATRGKLYVLGLLLAMLYYVPFLNLMVPVLSGLAFTHFGLARLAEMRAAERAARNET